MTKNSETSTKNATVLTDPKKSQIHPKKQKKTKKASLKLKKAHEVIFWNEEDPIRINDNVSITRIEAQIENLDGHIFIDSEVPLNIEYEVTSSYKKEIADEDISNFLERVKDETSFNFIRLEELNGEDSFLEKDIKTNEIESMKYALAELKKECNYPEGTTWKDIYEIEDDVINSGECPVDDCGKCGVRDKCWRFNN